MMQKNEFNNIISLARIHVATQEVNKYITDLNKMLDSVKLLQKINTDSISPTTHVTLMKNVWREDIVELTPKSIKKILFDNAPATENFFYKIRKVLNI
jgi:aspartyl-tRNA(Asn)/glutamyl-tRNA(Gln) amidotransferase subunit C